MGRGPSDIPRLHLVTPLNPSHLSYIQAPFRCENPLIKPVSASCSKIFPFEEDPPNITRKLYSPPTRGLLSFASRGEVMKLNRLIMVSLVGISLSTPAWACEHSGGGIFSFFHHCDHDQDNDGGNNHGSKRQCDQNGQNSGTGNNCDHGKGNGGGYCGTGGSSSGGSSSGGSGSNGQPSKGTP
jgi:hypothetical protein